MCLFLEILWVQQCRDLCEEYFPVTANIFPQLKILNNLFPDHLCKWHSKNITDDVHEMKEISIFHQKKKHHRLFIYFMLLIKIWYSSFRFSLWCALSA